MRGAYIRVRERRSLHSRFVVMIPMTVLLALAFGPIVTSSAVDWDWPPGNSADMEELDCDDIEDWGHQSADYYVFKYWYNGIGSHGYSFIGATRTTWSSGGLDYHISSLSVVDGSGYPVSGSGSQEENDPYGYLPRDGQSWQYNNDDNHEGEDRVGWAYQNSKYISLPATLVPATWSASVEEKDYVFAGFATDPSCWRQTDYSMRQGVTYYTASSGIASQAYMYFFVYYESRDYGWWSCYGGTYYDMASAWVKLIPN